MNATAAAPAKVKPEPIDNTELVLAFRAEGGNVLHIRPVHYGSGLVSRGMSIAFKVKSGRVELATSLQHRSDSFTKKLGTKTAINHFLAGKTIVVPVPKYQGVVPTLRDLFEELTSE